MTVKISINNPFKSSALSADSVLFSSMVKFCNCLFLEGTNSGITFITDSPMRSLGKLGGGVMPPDGFSLEGNDPEEVAWAELQAAPPRPDTGLIVRVHNHYVYVADRKPGSVLY